MPAAIAQLAGERGDFLTFVRFSDDKAIEYWGGADTMAMMQQLGVGSLVYC
jgi:predicted ester cyclase